MSRKAQKYIVILLVTLFSAVLFAMTAFAQENITPESDPVSASDLSGKPASSSRGSASEETGGTASITPPQENETISVKLNNQNGSKVKIVTVKPGGTVGSLPVPKRKGYTFDGWTMGGAKVSSSFEIYSEIYLVAQWKKEASSGQASSYASIDTHRNEIDQAASRAQEAISDPDVLSSENWDSILSSSSGNESGAGSSSQASSSASQKGGSSWLLPVGIGLIILSACGIGAFVYLQFFSGGSGPHGSGPHGTGPSAGTGGGGASDSSEGMEFTDISSNSDGSHAAKPRPSKNPPRRRRDSDNDDTMPIPRQPRHFRASSGQLDPSSRSQAKPVDGGKQNFDWDKFFNDDV